MERDRSLIFSKGGCDAKTSGTFPSNTVKTSKYEWYNFVPKNLWEQLHKFGNVYFLCISIIMYLGEKTPLFVGTIKAFSTLGLLMMMMSITAVMALYDDLRRKAADAEINGTTAKVITNASKGGKQKETTWASVRVGDILLIEKDEEFPADVVPLFCTGDGGNCYVSTANLDGETNLKLKTAPAATQSMLAGISPNSLGGLSALSGKVVAEPPSANIHDFNGSIDMEGAAAESLGAKQLLMRGTVLRNTSFCVGVVVYTGADTRMVRNSRPAPMKQSSLEVITNGAMVVILIVQGVLALISAIWHCVFQTELDGHWYLFPEKIILPEGVGWWLTFFTLYSNLMPISLYPTVEFCNAFQCYFIANDRKMFFKQKGFNNDAGFPAIARSSNLCAELGQVSYMFSDKTGTLTQNDMELKRVSIAGQKYGTFNGEAGAAGFSGAADMENARRGARGQDIDAFLEALAVSHTVMATTNAQGTMTYEAESPDEFALVSAAADLGWAFKGRRGTELWVDVSGGNVGGPTRASYTILASNAFNSARKRMSVVVRKDRQGGYGPEYLLLVKGADNVMLERAADKHVGLEADLKEFSMQGLRTLVIGSRKLSEDEVRSFQAKFDQAQRETRDREQKLADVAEEIEKNMTILGATAIEDKLQVGVPDCIEKIRHAGIKLWVLTGDKLETARNIGFSTKVLTPSMHISIIDEEEGTMDLDAVEESLSALRLDEKALMVTGQALGVLLSDEDSKLRLLEIAKECCVLIACRVSPKQKAEMVALVRENIPGPPVTLAVGDGANDVPMIQEAQVGVGIAGREGRQAVNNSDFAIAQFRYLEPLMLVHGRWNYRRACTYTRFTFWRNMVQVLMMMYYTWLSGFSGTALFEDWIRLSFNLLCTLPILPVGCTDEDVPARFVQRNPELYDVGRSNKDMSMLKMLHTVLSAVAHSLVLTWVTISAFPGMDLRGTGDYYTFGTTCYTCLLIAVNYQAVFNTHTHNIYTIGTVVMSFVGYAMWLIAYPTNPWLVEKLAPNMYMVPAHMIRNVYFWFCVVAVPLFAMMLDVFISFVYHHLFPDLVDQAKRRGLGKIEPGDASEQEDLLAASASSEEDLSDESDRDGDLDDEDRKHIDLSDFAQRRIWKQRMSCSKRHHGVMLTGILGGTIFFVLGFVALQNSEQAAQVRIPYAESKSPATSLLDQFWQLNPVGTRENEIFPANCSAAGDGLGEQCVVSVKVPQRMVNPLIYYTIGPFYQNYNSYMRSEVIQELQGQTVSEDLRASRCVEPTRVTADGKAIVPCGMKATSLFNDTFTIAGYTISRNTAAWRTDVARYQNPKDYPTRPNASWLFQRYPHVVNESRGVKSEAFVDWMRPSAMPRIWNRYGSIEGTFEAGATFIMTIESVFPIASIAGGKKSVVVAELNTMGSRHSAFGYVLAFGGVVCYVLALAAWLTTKCCKRPSVPSRSSHGEESGSAEGSEEDSQGCV